MIKGKNESNKNDIMDDRDDTGATNISPTLSVVSPITTLEAGTTTLALKELLKERAKDAFY